MLGFDVGLDDGTAEALLGRSLGKLEDDGKSLGPLLGIDDGAVDGTPEALGC